MNNQLEQDFELHGYEKVSESPGEVVFETTKKEYMDKKDEKIHETHPIWFDDQSKNIKGSGSRVIIKIRCAHCNKPIVDGVCVECGRSMPMPTAKNHIPWKHELKGN